MNHLGRFIFDGLAPNDNSAIPSYSSQNENLGQANNSFLSSVGLSQKVHSKLNSKAVDNDTGARYNMTHDTVFQNHWHRGHL